MVASAPRGPQLVTGNGTRYLTEEAALLTLPRKKFYVAESRTGRLYSYDVVGPGQLGGRQPDRPSQTLLWSAPGRYGFDSIAVDGDGNICVTTIGAAGGIDVQTGIQIGVGGICVVKPTGGLLKWVATNDALTTNIAFGGPDMMDAFITLSQSGRLAKMKWHCKGHKCHFENLLDPSKVILGSKL